MLANVTLDDRASNRMMFSIAKYDGNVKEICIFSHLLVTKGEILGNFMVIFIDFNPLLAVANASRNAVSV
jgi:hypothetical protein